MVLLRLKELRKKKQISQQKLAIDLNVSQAAISKYEQGLAEPDIRMLKEMSEYFGVSIDYLVGRTKQNIFFTENTYNEREKELLYYFKKLQINQKEKVFAYIQGMLDA